MHQEAKEMTVEAVLDATRMSASGLSDRIALAEVARDDMRRADRKQDCLCRWCFYYCQPRIGGCAMTIRPCGICGIEELYSSTATDVVCRACAIEHKICRQCGGDVELRHSRRKFAWLSAKPINPLNAALSRIGRLVGRGGPLELKGDSNVG